MNYNAVYYFKIVLAVMSTIRIRIILVIIVIIITPLIVIEHINSRTSAVTVDFLDSIGHVLVDVTNYTEVIYVIRNIQNGTLVMLPNYDYLSANINIP